jgi:hypothetical protein
MNDADIHAVALVLGHKDLRIAARYQHLSPTFLTDVPIPNGFFELLAATIAEATPLCELCASIPDA